MTKCAFIPNFFKFYNILWQAARPFLKQNPRLAPTFARRVGWAHLSPADVWIQAASAGEAFLALSILRALAPEAPVRILATTTTDQGMEILEAGLREKKLNPNIRVDLDLFPFDMPETVAGAVARVNPRAMVLLETELWPALLHALKQNRTRILVLNARMSARSSRHYRATRFLWHCLAPDRILATSREDAHRWTRVFPGSDTGVMENIKFDIMDTGGTGEQAPELSALFPGPRPLSIIASLRRQEEPDLPGLVQGLTAAVPDQVVAVFPRHMHRIPHVARLLRRHHIRFCLRSGLTSPMAGPGVVLWDRFGELRQAYAMAAGVFVGGSLRPLGGQNFIEPAVLGVPTVTGPYWDDFIWVGKKIFDHGIVTQCSTPASVAATMAGYLKAGGPCPHRRKKAREYVRSHQGGSRAACSEILAALRD